MPRLREPEIVDIPIVVFTVLPRERKQLHMVADAWVVKPGDIFDILGRAERLIAARREASEA